MGESGLFFQREQGVSRQDMPIFVQTDFFTHRFCLGVFCPLDEQKILGRRDVQRWSFPWLSSMLGWDFQWCPCFCGQLPPPNVPVSKSNKLINLPSWTWWDHLFVLLLIPCLGWRKLLENSFQRCSGRLEVISHTLGTTTPSLCSHSLPFLLSPYT